MFSRLFIGILLLIMPSAAYGSVGSLDSTGLWGGSFSPSSGIEALPAGAVSKDSLEARGYKEPLPTWKDIEFSFGLKLGGGGDLLLPPSGSSYTEPGNDYSFSMPIFDGIRGGYNYTVGFFGDLRLFRYLGVESGIVLTRHTLKETTNWTYSETKPDNSVVTLKSRSEETMTWGTIRIPVMFRFIAPVGDNHIWFGAGPEFSFGQWARGDMNISTTGAPLQGERSKLQATHDSGVSPLQGVTTNETWLTVGFGYMVQAARNMKIPIDFRFGWNPDQPDDYFERMSFCPENLPCGTLPTSATDEDRYVSRVIMRAQTSMYAEILVGLLYNLY